MVRLKYRLLPELSVDGILPLAVALIDYQDILDAGIDMPAACQAVANCIDGPVAINIIDLDAVTTTSDGIMIPSANPVHGGRRPRKNSSGVWIYPYGGDPAYG